MPAYYTVVQYVPDPIAGERINVGVIVFGAGRIQSRFLQNWERVRRFADEDIEYVREFADWVDRAAAHRGSVASTAPLPGFPVPVKLDEETIRAIADEWSNSIQLTVPQPSLEHPDVLLSRVAQAYLREPVTRPRLYRDRQAAARFTVATAKRAVRERLGIAWADKVVHSHYAIRGKLVPFIRVDMALANGQILAASQALSFETTDVRALERQISEAVYTLRDIGELRNEIRRDLLVFPPNPELPKWRELDDKFRNLPKMCLEIGAGLVVEEEAPDWANRLADLVNPEVLERELAALHA